MTNIAPDRRTVVRGAAWAVPAVSVAAIAPALAASTLCELAYQSVTKSFTYIDGLSNQVVVDVTATFVPLTVPGGATLAAVETSTIAHLSDGARNAINFFLGSPAYFGGTSTSVSTISGAVTADSESALTIPLTAMPASGPVDLNASGASSGQLTVPEGTPAGTATITMGEPASHLLAYDADKQPTGGAMDTVLSKIAGNDYVLATFEIC